MDPWFGWTGQFKDANGEIVLQALEKGWAGEFPCNRSLRDESYSASVPGLYGVAYRLHKPLGGVMTDSGPGFFAANRVYPVRMWDPSRVDWTGAGIDAFGIIGDVALLFPPYGVAIWTTSEIPELASVGTSWDQLEMGNPTDVLIDTGVTIAESAKLIPEWGSTANVVSLVVNLSQGFYQAP